MPFVPFLQDREQQLMNLLLASMQKLLQGPGMLTLHRNWANPLQQVSLHYVGSLEGFISCGSTPIFQQALVHPDDCVSGSRG